MRQGARRGDGAPDITNWTNRTNRDNRTNRTNRAERDHRSGGLRMMSRARRVDVRRVGVSGGQQVSAHISITIRPGACLQAIVYILSQERQAIDGSLRR